MPMQQPTAQHGDLFPGLWAFLASISIEQLIMSFWIGHSWSKQNTSCPYSIFTACDKVNFHTEFSIIQIFIVFIFMCRTCIRNIQKLAQYKISHYTQGRSHQSGIKVSTWPLFPQAFWKLTDLDHLKMGGACCDRVCRGYSDNTMINLTFTLRVTHSYL